MTTTFTGTTTSFTATTSIVTLSTQDNNRGGIVIHNNASLPMNVLLGAGTVTTTFYTYEVPPNWTLEIPFDYVGLITATWPAGATGNANVTVLSL